MGILSRKKPSALAASPRPFPDLWESVLRFSQQIKTSEFMKEMLRRYEAQRTHGVMGVMDCATLYGLVRWHRPTLVVESGGWLGMSAAFILKALADAGLTEAKLYSIEWNKDCPHGVLIPEELRERFVPLNADVRELVKTDALPATIDMFLHDSSHRYAHMLWEFRTFWPRLRDGGLLASHDVDLTASFPEFIAQTYAHDKKGLLDAERTTHYEWGRWGYLGFALKKGR